MGLYAATMATHINILAATWAQVYPNFTDRSQRTYKNLVLSRHFQHRVRLQTTIAGAESLQGVILNVSPSLNIIAIVTAPPPSTHHILALSALKDFELLPPSAFSMPVMAAPERPPPLDMDAAMARANAALAKAKEKAAKRNLSVGKEVQEIFDAIGKTLPVRWDGKDIVVMDQVVVKGPGYKGDDCVAGKNAGQGALPRVRKVVSDVFS